jgi:cellulose synthase/poly-beta-1,6-N-acetylglucosamine synthase-like glycosyltransferase
VLALTLSVVIIAALAAYHGFNLVMIALAGREVGRQRWRGARRAYGALQESGLLPGVTAVVPAYNEEIAIVRTVDSILRLDYPDLQVVVVSDGSTDDTVRSLMTAFALQPSTEQPNGALATQNIRAVFSSRTDPRLVVVDKRNGGKADALNVGINMAQTPLVLAVDADVMLDRRALVHLALPFLLHPHTVASSGIIRPSNGCRRLGPTAVRGAVPRRLLEGFQVLEYLRAYGVGRLFFNQLQAHLIISGAFGLFDRALLLEMDGYQPHAVGEDIELVTRIHRHCLDRGRPYRIEFSAHALCLTETPRSLRDFGRQRSRWHQGLLSTLRIHRQMAFDRRFGTVGALTFPYFLLELYAPALEMVGWLTLPALWWAGMLPQRALVLFIGVSVLLSTSVSLAAILLDALCFDHFRRASDRMRLVALALLEHVGYRQCTIYYRLRGFFRYYRSIHLKSSWTSPARTTPGVQ